MGKTRLCVHDFMCLNTEVWLNDQIINSYGELISEQYNSFVFHTRFLEKGFQKTWINAEIWTKRLVFFPMHENSHWYLIVFDTWHQEISILDSLTMEPKQAKTR